MPEGLDDIKRREQLLTQLEKTRRRVEESARKEISATLSLEKESTSVTEMVTNRMSRLTALLASGADESSARIQALRNQLRLLKLTHKDAFAAAKISIQDYNTNVVGGSSKASALATAMERERVMKVVKGLRSVEGIQKGQLKRAQGIVAQENDSTVLGHTERLKRLSSLRFRDAKAKEINDKKIAETEKKLHLSSTAAHDDASKRQIRAREAVRTSAKRNVGTIAESNTMMGAFARTAAQVLPGVDNLIKAEDEEARTGERMGGVHAVASEGLSALAGTFGEVFTKMTPLIAVGTMLGKVLMTLLEGFDRVRKIGGQGMRVLAAGGNASFTNLITDGAKYTHFLEADLINAFDKVTVMGLRGLSMFEEFTPQAHKAALSFGGITDIPSAAKFTTELVQSGAAAHSFGLEVEDGMQIATQMGKAFTKDGVGVYSIFRKQAAAAQAAGLSFQDFGAALGDVVEIGKAWGDQQQMYSTLAGLAGGKGMTRAQRSLTVETAMGMTNAPLSRILGMRIASSGGGMGAAVKALTEGKGDMAAFTMESFRGVMQKLGGTKMLEGGLKEGNYEKFYQAVEMAGGTAGASEAFKKAMFTSEDFRNNFMQLSGRAEEDAGIVKKMEKIIAEQDPAKAGIRLMTSQKATLDLIHGAINEGVRMVAQMAASWMFSGGLFGGDSRAKAIASQGAGAFSDMRSGEQLLSSTKNAGLTSTQVRR